MSSTEHNIIKPDPVKVRTAWVRAGLLLAVAAGAGTLAATDTGLSWAEHAGLSESHFDQILGVVTGLCATLAGFVIWKSRFNDEGNVASRIDEFQSRQRQILIAITILVAGFGAFAIAHALHAEGPLMVDFSIEFALLALAVAAATTFGVGFAQRRYRQVADDELVRQIRGRAAQIGYMIAMTGLTVNALFDAIRPDLTALGMPIALLAGVIVPTTYFLIAERRASNDG